MGIKKNLLGLVLGTSMMIGGGIGIYKTLQSMDRTEYQRKEYKRLLDINDEKIKRGSKDLISEEKVVKYKDYMNKTREFVMVHIIGSSLPLGLVMGGLVIIGYNSNKIKDYYKNKKSSSKTFSTIKPSKLEEKTEEIDEEKPKHINPWKADIDEIENKRY